MTAPTPTLLVGADRFQCAFVAIGYLLDRRGTDLLARLAQPRSSAYSMVSRLSHSDRRHRAYSLAAGLAPVVHGLDGRTIA